jgi:hypothetical protein
VRSQDVHLPTFQEFKSCSVALGLDLGLGSSGVWGLSTEITGCVSTLLSRSCQKFFCSLEFGFEFRQWRC